MCVFTGRRQSERGPEVLDFIPVMGAISCFESLTGNQNFDRLLLKIPIESNQVLSIVFTVSSSHFQCE